MTTDQQFVQRAVIAYTKRALSTSGTVSVTQPADTSGVREHQGLRYVVLENANGPLAVYRINNRSELKRLVRWPEALTAS